MGYLVECKRTNATDWIRCNVPKNLQDTHYVVTGLLENSEYQLRVTAVNKVGFSQHCEVPDKHVAKDVFGKKRFFIVAKRLPFKSLGSNVFHDLRAYIKK